MIAILCGKFNFIRAAKLFPGGCAILFDFYKEKLVIFFEKQMF